MISYARPASLIKLFCICVGLCPLLAALLLRVGLNRLRLYVLHLHSYRLARLCCLAACLHEGALQGPALGLLLSCGAGVFQDLLCLRMHSHSRLMLMHVQAARTNAALSTCACLV